MALTVTEREFQKIQIAVRLKNVIFYFNFNFSNKECLNFYSIYTSWRLYNNYDIFLIKLLSHLNQ